MVAKNNSYSGIDWILIAIYFLLAMCGLTLIFSALYNGDTGEGFALPPRIINQLVWLGMSVCVSFLIMLVDSKYWHIYSYYAYFFMLALLIGVGLFTPVINGARSWIVLGGFSFQPAEFMKVIAALAISRYMSSYSFDMSNKMNFLTMCALLAMPVLVIKFLQNDTGSALVFVGFLFMLYREGLNHFFYIALLSLIAIFVASFLLEPFAVVALIIYLTIIASTFSQGRHDVIIRYLFLLSALFVILFGVFGYFEVVLGADSVLLIAFTLTIPLLIYFVKMHGGYMVYLIYIILATAYYYSVNYVFNVMIQLHQQKRILALLGIERDIYGWGYNVHQSQISIGSGGLLGKGFLNGTQTKFNFVPEQSTDFIFCTVGEEFGFIGSVFVVLLFGALILRLIVIGDNMTSGFSRIYCYCVASVFLFHVLINIGMTIGIIPVIGIPLPFFSYGGSSFLTFTVMLAIVLKLNKDNFDR